MELLFNTADGPLEASKDTLLVFIDETGHEKLADRKYPIFGLGGCVVRADQYLSTVHNPWAALKLSHFPRLNGPLHATGLRPTAAQAAGIAEVFTTGRFGRIAAVLSDRTTITVPHTRYQITTTSFTKRFDQVCPAFWPFKEVYFVHESSDRANHLAVRFFGPFDRVIVAGADAQDIELLITHCFAPKAALIAGLEVADFIMHAAGKCVYGGGTRVPQARARRDFQAVFGSVPHALASFQEIHDVRRGSLPARGTK